ncbi:MAG: beta-lactamase family protein [Mariniphaga sp.]|nr:beta-lactamase family protein [Mariniphaga sp.]
MKQLFTFILISTIIFSLNAQTFDRQKMDNLFNLIEENNKSMGSISIFQDGKEVYQKSIGFVDINNNLMSNATTIYRIGSISKTFTTTIIMQMVEEKKLTLETKLSKWFKKIPNSEKISIKQLLGHRSGLFNFTNAEGYASQTEKPKSRSEQLKTFIKNGTVFEPGEKAEYSNTNFVLLSFIIEEVENKPFSEVLDERIVERIGLKNTSYGGKINTANNEALSYRKENNWVLNTETDMSIPMGAGAIVSTPTDLNIFFNKLFAGELISVESLNKMKNIVDGYGLGLFTYPFSEKQSFGHTGGIDGFRAIASIFPDENVAISFCRNGENMSGNDILIGALSIYFVHDYELPEFAPAIVLNIEVLEQYSGTYSSPTAPLKLKIFIDGDVLKAQGEGQPSFPLEAFDENKFKFEQAGVQIEFIPSESKLILKQGGGTFEMAKE